MRKSIQQLFVLMGALVLTACATSESVTPTSTPTPAPPTETPNATATAAILTYMATLEAMRSPDVPALPFADNPDPALCGIPTQWGLTEPAWLTGYYEGELIQEEVLLYDSHLRLDIAGSAPHGAKVEVLLFQQNPMLNYYLVKVAETGAEGWIPEPLLSFEPLEPTG